MKNRYIGILGITVAVTTIIWIILMVVSDSTTAAVSTIEDKIELIESEQFLYWLSYLNATLLTFLNIMFMSALYLYCKKKNDFWSTLAFTFIPIYGIANLFSYLSQVFLIPEMIQLYQTPQTQNFARVLLILMIHTWPGSVIEAINGMAYALLAIPSIILPLIGLREPKQLVLGGYFLMASGFLSILAFIGILSSEGYLTILSVIGGIIFLISLFPISLYFLRTAEEEIF